MAHEGQYDEVPQSPEQVATGDGDAPPEELTDQQAKLLIRVLRVAYPHPSFPDAPYDRASKAVQDAEGADDVLVAGLRDLDERAGGDFAALDDEQATEILKAVDGSPFFTLIKATTVVALYDDHEVWDLLGYEGSSFDKGGYLNRGFDDLDWLPDPRIEEYDGAPRPELVTETAETAQSPAKEQR
ncbi:gluconate 2-dehydrogenase subunit 3 family protein [Epidermidibacterium keratini]|uniref:hypothetical protein n=1 Tax=Epidermidibacterium keratini TaxID=1891644 RepID=UPI0018659421|nr:hypothetical protein [Epidermidibacterium keratini]